MSSPQEMERSEDHTEEVTTRCGFVYYSWRRCYTMLNTLFCYHRYSIPTNRQSEKEAQDAAEMNVQVFRLQDTGIERTREGRFSTHRLNINL